MSLGVDAVVRLVYRLITAKKNYNNLNPYEPEAVTGTQ